MGYPTILETQHTLSIRIDESSEADQHAQHLQGLTELTKFNITTQQFLTIAFYQMKKLADLLRDRHYAFSRRNEFPFQKFHELEALMRGVIK